MSRSILVVDDDASFRELAARILASWGHVVVGEAGSVGEALARAAELEPDTVLADIGLPDGDGFELAQRLLDMPGRPTVLLISSEADRADDAAARRVGARGFFPKDELTGDALRRAIDG